MSWIRSQIAALTSRETRHTNHLPQSPVLPSHGPVDNQEPATNLKYFDLFWHDASAILQKPIPSQEKHTNKTSTLDDCDILIHFTDKMVKLLTQESAPIGCDPLLLNYFYEKEVLNKVLAFSCQRPEYRSRLAVHQLCIYDTLITHSQQQLLSQKQFVGPLLCLLEDCKREQMKDENVEEKLLIVLHQLCVAVTQDLELLELLIECSIHDTSSKYFDISMLLPYAHQTGAVGQQARDDLLLLISLSCSRDSISKYITEKTDFCQVLVVSLSGLYSSLPRTLTYGSDDWHCITEQDVTDNTDLQMFLNLLEFCNALIQVSHPAIQDQMLNFVYSGFLVSVIGPTLHQVHSGMEEAIAVTAYLDLFVRKITEPHLLKIFLKFILTGKLEDVTVMEALIQRITSSNTRLCMVTLTLFRTLVDLNCEDVMYQLVFKYLLPCTHIMVSQQRSVSDTDIYCKAAEKLLSLIPTSCNIEGQNVSNSYNTEELETALQQRTNRRTSIKSETEETVIPVGAGNMRNSCLSESGPLSPKSSYHCEWNYLEYLLLARIAIEECMQACRNWSSVYGASENQTLSGLSSPSNSALTDPSSSDDLATGVRNKDLNSRDMSESISIVCDEATELNSRMDRPRHGDDLLPFLIELNRIPLPERLDESENVLSELDVLIAEIGEQVFLEGDLMFDGVSSPKCFQRVPKNGSSEISQLRTTVIPDGSISDSHISVHDTQIQNSDGLSVVSATTTTSDAPSVDTNHVTTVDVSVNSAKKYLGVLGTPTIGPFLTALLNKLEAMKQNTLYVNLQLTGLITRLACYPQPLLSSLLLSHTLVFQPSIKSLMQVLNTVKCRVEEFLYKTKDKDEMLEQAYNYLLWRDTYQERERRISEDKTSTSSRRSSLMFLNSPKTADNASSSSMISRLKLLDNKRGAYYATKPQKLQTAVKETQEAVEKKNAIYCTVIFKEFLKELAAISQEHALLLTQHAS